MKKIILIAAIAFVSKFSEAQVSFGLHVGANMGMGKFKYPDAALNSFDSHSQKNKTKIGVIGGFIAEIQIGSSLAFRPELNYSMEGTKFTATGTDNLAGTYIQKQEISLSYIKLPLNVIYKVPAGTGNVFFGLGPELGIGLSGKNKFTDITPFSSDKQTYDVKFDGKKSDDIDNPAVDEPMHLKRVDVGLNVLAGYKLDMGVFIQLGYNHGLMDINPDKKNADADEKRSYKNSGFNISVGYMFGGNSSSKKKK